MSHPRLPGLPTVAALMLATIMVVWLGLWGPIHLDRLQQWQTLLAAIIAPSIALYAATLAYRGAMAKVNLDRAELDRRQMSEQLGLFLRVRAAAERVSEESGARIAMLNFQPSNDALRTSITIGPEQLSIAVPVELNEAWSRLDIFPAALIRQIEILRRLLPVLQSEMEKFAAQKWTVEWVRPRYLIDLPGAPVYRFPVPDDYLVLYSKRCGVIKQSSDILLAGLSSAIESLRQ
jgi:hypothetical protein